MPKKVDLDLLQDEPGPETLLDVICGWVGSKRRDAIEQMLNTMGPGDLLAPGVAIVAVLNEKNFTDNGWKSPSDVVLQDIALALNEELTGNFEDDFETACETVYTLKDGTE